MLTLQIGQCGNQLGHAFFQRLAEEEHRGAVATSAFFRTRDDDNGRLGGAASARRVARAVLIDMEPKVVAQSLRLASESSVWEYDARNTFAQQSGSGNNWAYGYMVHGEQHYDTLHDLVQRVRKSMDGKAVGYGRGLRSLSLT
ncbi:hypothetical protein PINS_up000971 [Pythium insidiosum]|nr:hypothetical protein PINS_up000971 [Pythium insidiosum]